MSQLQAALAELQREDPTLESRTDPVTGQLLLCGQGELHLEVTLHRLQREYSMPDLQLGRVRVALCEGIESGATQLMTSAWGTSPLQQFDPSIEESRASELNLSEMDAIAAITMEVTALSLGSADENLIDIDATLPDEVSDAIEEGIRRALTRGPITGSTMIGCQVRVLDVKATVPLSGVKGGAKSLPLNQLQACAHRCTTRALDSLQKSQSIQVLEPQMHCTITTDTRFIGDIASDLTSRRRAAILEASVDDATASDREILQAMVPLSELIGYSGQLRTQSQGSGHLNMVPSGYAVVPPHLIAKLSE